MIALESLYSYTNWIEIHPDGHSIAAACSDNSVKLWDCRSTYRLLQHYTGADSLKFKLTDKHVILDIAAISYVQLILLRSPKCPFIRVAIFSSHPQRTLHSESTICLKVVLFSRFTVTRYYSLRVEYSTLYMYEYSMYITGMQSDYTVQVRVVLTGSTLYCVYRYYIM